MARRITFVSKDQSQSHQSINHDVSPMKHNQFDLGNNTHHWRTIQVTTTNTSQLNANAVTVTGNVTANAFIGDGSNLTGIVGGFNNGIQFNNSGSFDAATRFVFDSATERVSIGTPTFMAKLQVHDSLEPDPQDGLGDMSYYQLGVSGSQSAGEGVGVALGTLDNVGGAILFTDRGAESQGDLSFYTKESAARGDAPVERMVIKYNGNVGVGVSNPLSAFEVAPSVGLSNDATDGGAFNFSVTTNTPTANSTLGTINFGSSSYKNAYIESVNPTGWRLYNDPLGGNHHAEMNFYATRENSWGSQLVANLDADFGLTLEGSLSAADNSTFLMDLNVDGDLSVGRNITSSMDITATGTVTGGNIVSNGNFTTATGDVSALNGSVRGAFLYGDGSNITNLPIQNPGGNDEQIQFNDNGSFGAANIHYNDLTGKTSFSSFADYGGVVTITKDLGTNPNTNPHLANNHHLMIRVPFTSTTNEGGSIGFGDDNGITASVSSITTDSNAEGGLAIRVKNNNTRNGALTLGMLVTDSIYGYLPTVFSSTVVSNGTLTGLNTVVSIKNTDPQEEGNEVDNYQFQARSNDSGSAGISFGNASTVGAGIVAIPNTNSLGVADLNFKTRPTSGSGMLSNIYIASKTGNVGINTTAPSYKLDVNGEMRADGVSIEDSIPTLNLEPVTALPTSGFPLGDIVGKDQSKIRFAAYSNWTSTSKPTNIQFWNTAPSSTQQSLTVNISKENTYINSDTLRVTNDMLVSGESTFNGESTFTDGIQETSANGITCTIGPIKAPTVVADKYYSNSTSLTDGNFFLDTIYYTNSDTTALDFKFITTFDVYNKNNTRRVIRTDTLNSKGCIYLTANDSATNGTYAQAANASTHGVYVEGTSSGSGANTTSSFTVVTNNTYEEWIVNGSSGTSYTHNQVGIDIVCGKGIRDYYQSGEGITTRQDEPTSDTKYMRFYAHYRGYTSDADYGDPSKHNKIVVGKIFGNGNGGVTYHSSFTGQHATIIDKSDTLKEGMIVGSTGQMWHGNTMDTALPKVQVSSKANDKTVFGVIHTLEGRHDGYVSSSPPKETEQHIEVNSIGEGRVLVTNAGGNVENGDYITSSLISGYGMKQEDDLLHSYTVAKCTESINWESITDTIEHNGQVYKVYLSACTYHCG